MPIQTRRRGFFRSLGFAGWISAAFLAAPLVGCRDMTDVTGSISRSDQPMPTDQEGLRAYADRWGKAYDSNPGEKVASINYARALRALTRYSEAEAVMRVAAVKAPKDYEVLGAYGKALADAGEFAQAKDVLTRAYPIERPDWTILSVQGSVEDRLGNYDGAQNFYREALKISPGEPTVLSNLGLSYALTKQLPLAEADATPGGRPARRPTRAFVKIWRSCLRLTANFPKPSRSAVKDMSAEDAARNVQAIRAMIAQNDTWRTLQSEAREESGPRPPRTGCVAIRPGSLPAEPSASRD